MLYTMGLNPSTGQYIGYQILVGVGVGLSIQIPVMACQSLVDPVDIPVVTSMVLCTPFHVLPWFSIFITNNKFNSLPTYQWCPLRLRCPKHFRQPACRRPGHLRALCLFRVSLRRRRDRDSRFILAFSATRHFTRVFEGN